MTIEQLQKVAVASFIALVEERAEAKMLKTHTLEGAHYAAMKEIAAEMGIVMGEVQP